MTEGVTPRRQLFHETAEYLARKSQAAAVEIAQDTTTSEVPVAVGAVAVGGPEIADIEMEEYPLPLEPTEKQRATMNARNWRFGATYNPRNPTALGAWSTRFNEW